VSEYGYKETVEAICDLLSRAGLTYEIDQDRDILVSEGLDFPMWIAVSPTRPLVKFFACANFRNGADVDTAAALRLANEMTMRFMPNGCFYADGALWGQCFLSLKGGLADAVFLDTLARSAAGFITAVETCDSEDLIA